MIFDIQIGDISANRRKIVEVLRERKRVDPSFTVVDVGGSAGGWAHEITDVIVDMIPTNATRYFQVNLNRYTDWEKVRDYVAKHGKFSFAICSHTLEDISNPSLVLEMLPKIATEGLIAVPSKYREFSHVEGVHLGYIHHRWIFDIRDEEPRVFVGYPKLGFLETYTELHRLGSAIDSVAELSFKWKEDISYRIVNDDYLGPSYEAVRTYYRALL